MQHMDTTRGQASLKAAGGRAEGASLQLPITLAGKNRSDRVLALALLAVVNSKAGILQTTNAAEQQHK
jgi:hypothetical protein